MAQQQQQEQMHHAMAQLNLKGDELKNMILRVKTKMNQVRNAKIGVKNPGEKWLIPLTASTTAVWQTKKASLGAKSKCSDRVDKVLLELDLLHKEIITAQEVSYKYAVLKKINKDQEDDRNVETKRRRAKQVADIEATATRQAAASAKRAKREFDENQFDSDNDTDSDNDGADLR